MYTEIDYRELRKCTLRLQTPYCRDAHWYYREHKVDAHWDYRELRRCTLDCTLDCREHTVDAYWYYRKHKVDAHWDYRDHTVEMPTDITENILEKWNCFLDRPLLLGQLSFILTS